MPYSVFLGPGGAQFDVPQIYWHAIGTTPDAAYAHTFIQNRIYGRVIAPLGQIYGGVSAVPGRALPPGRGRLRGARRLVVGLAVGERRRAGARWTLR